MPKDITDKVQDLELKTNTNTLHLSDFGRRIDSYHLEQKEKLNKLDKKLESIPTEDAIFRMFSKEGEKLARGILKQVDEVKKDVTGANDKVYHLETHKNEVKGLISGAKWQAGYVFTAKSYLGNKKNL